LDARKEPKLVPLLSENTQAEEPVFSKQAGRLLIKIRILNIIGDTGTVVEN